MVTPTKILGADYAVALQRQFLLEHRIVSVDCSRAQVFRASISVVVVVLGKVDSSLEDEIVLYQYDDTWY